MLRQNDPATPLAHDTAYYRELIFGPSFPNVAGYFAAVSNQQFKLVEAATIVVQNGAITDALKAQAQIPPDEKDEAQLTRYATLQWAEDNGFKFSDYDANRDGTVDKSELSILQIDAGSDVGGQTRVIDCTQHSGVQVCPDLSLAGQSGELMLYAHELMHQTIDAADAYGVEARLNSGVTTMAGTGTPDARFAYYLDPFHRNTADWETRIAWPTAGSSGSATLSAVADEGDPSGTRYVGFSSPAYDERLYFELRSRVPGSYDQDVHEGVYAWFAALTPDRTAVRTLSGPFEVGGQQDDALFVLATEACIGDPNSPSSRGVVKSLELGGSYRFRWLNGDDTGLIFHLEATPDGRQRVLSWTPSSDALSCTEGGAPPPPDVSTADPGSSETPSDGPGLGEPTDPEPSEEPSPEVPDVSTADPLPSDAGSPSESEASELP